MLLLVLFLAFEPEFVCTYFFYYFYIVYYFYEFSKGRDLILCSACHHDLISPFQTQFSSLLCRPVPPHPLLSSEPPFIYAKTH